MKKIVIWIIAAIVAAIFLFRATAQQLQMNEYTARKDALEEQKQDLEEQLAEYETMNDFYMSDEYIIEEALKRGLVPEDAIIFREAE